MPIKPLLSFVALCALTAAARADGLFVGQNLPTLALDPQPPPSIWSGLSVGTQTTVAVGKGGKARVGGGAMLGYDHAFANGLVLGIGATSGFAPVSLPHNRFQGYDVAGTDVKLGYDMGRLMPYVTAGVVLAKPSFRSGFANASDSVNGLFGGNGNPRVFPRVGAGVEYAITNNLHVSLGVEMNAGGALTH